MCDDFPESMIIWGLLLGNPCVSTCKPYNKGNILASAFLIALCPNFVAKSCSNVKMIVLEPVDYCMSGTVLSRLI